jgi:sulfate permease, SulP family
MRFSRDFEPKLVTVLREGYTRSLFAQDAMAGIVVGFVALPQAIAFAIACGVRPEQGLVTAVVAGFLIAALGGSRVQIGGPTGAFVVLVYEIVHRHGYEGLAIATMMAGVLLLIMGLMRLGAVIRFVPYPVTVGFTSGIALIIAASQIRDALGLQMDSVPPDFLHKLPAYSAHLESANLWAVAVCAGTILIVRLWPRLSARVPGPLVALIAMTAVVQLAGLPVETIASRFGAVPTELPMPSLPAIEWAKLRELLAPAIAIALLGGIESLLSAVVADGMTGRRHRSNAELVAQGVANLATPLFGGIPATGAIARTATNVKSGARTPVAGMIHAATLLMILLVAGDWAELIPMPVLAGILLVVAYNMSEWQMFAGLLRGPRSDILVLATTFALTVLVDLVVAIQVGVVMAALLFMRRMAEVTQVRVITTQLSEEEGADTRDPALAPPPGVEVFDIRGSFFFGSAQKFSEVIATVEHRPKVVILRMREVLAMDATGLKALEETHAKFRRLGTALLISGAQPQPLTAMRESGFIDRLGADNALETFRAALARAREIAGDASPAAAGTIPDKG